MSCSLLVCRARGLFVYNTSCGTLDKLSTHIHNMPRSSKKQGSANQCNHRDVMNLPECLRLLETLSTAQQIDDAFAHASKALANFVDLCVKAPCSHFQRAFMDDLYPGLCIASARALQLLHSSGAFQQQPPHLLPAVSELLSSLSTCHNAGDNNDPARTERSPGAMNTAGGCVRDCICSQFFCHMLAIAAVCG